jgi:hypothetical protein
MNKGFFARMAEFFQDPDGKMSNGRLNRSVTLYVGLIITCLGYVKGVPPDYTLISLFLGYGFVTETTTKAIESRAARVAQSV